MPPAAGLRCRRKVLTPAPRVDNATGMFNAMYSDAELCPAVETVEAEFFRKAVTGRIDIDAEWDSCPERRARAGGGSSTPPVNAAWRESK